MSYWMHSEKYSCTTGWRLGSYYCHKALSYCLNFNFSLGSTLPDPPTVLCVIHAKVHTVCAHGCTNPHSMCAPPTFFNLRIRPCVDREIFTLNTIQSCLVEHLPHACTCNNRVLYLSGWAWASTTLWVELHIYIYLHGIHHSNVFDTVV